MTAEGFAVAWLLFVMLLVGAMRAGATPPRSEAETMAALCVAETGWRDHDVCAAQIFVLKRIAERRGRSLTSVARAYSTPLREGDERRPWIANLRNSDRRPEGWRRGSWRRHRAWYVDLIGHIENVLAGDVEDPCPDADHFGGWMDRHRMRARWVEVCVGLDETRPIQHFWGRR